MLVKGDWGAGAYDLTIDGIDLVPPTPEQAATQRERAEALRAEQEKQARLERERIERRERLLRDGADHPADGPRVDADLDARADDVGREANRGRVHPRRPAAVRAARPATRSCPTAARCWRGRTASRRSCPRAARSCASARAAAAGSGSARCWPTARRCPSTTRRTGAAVTADTLDAPAAYVLRSEDDPAYAGGVAPTEAFRKSKPTARQAAVVEHWVYLEAALAPDARRALHARVPRRQHGASRRRNSSTTARKCGARPSRPRTSATGPADPFKRALLSEWLGTGGAFAFDADHVRAARRERATSPSPATSKQRARAADEAENLIGDKNRTGTNVYALGLLATSRRPAPTGFTSPASARAGRSRSPTACGSRRLRR